MAAVGAERFPGAPRYPVNYVPARRQVVPARGKAISARVVRAVSPKVNRFGISSLGSEAKLLTI
jgi:hypothetical protein